MGQSWPLFVYFRYFLDTISIIQIEKSIDGVLGIRTWGRRMAGTDETMELWQPPLGVNLVCGKVLNKTKIWKKCSLLEKAQYCKNNQAIYLVTLFTNHLY